MNVEELRAYCLDKPATEECFPFDDVTRVFKVLDKVFLLAGLYSVPLSFNVKCDPDIAEDLREKYDCVTPGYHMNKKHWNTITVDKSVSDKLLQEWIDDSYNLIVASFNKSQKKAYSELL